MTADLLIPQPLPLVDYDSSSIDYDAADLFDPLPLNSQNDSDLLVSDVEDFLRSPIKTSRKCPRRVSFEDHHTEISVPSFACLGEADRRSLWYHSIEIDRFRSVARHTCRSLRKNPVAYFDTRGLELRTSQDRQYRKHLALNCILKAQLRFPKIDPLHLAAIADRCTSLPRQEALAQGTRDFCDAYCGALPITSEADMFVPNYNKRGPNYVVSGDYQQPQPKRRRFVDPQEQFVFF